MARKQSEVPQGTQPRTYVKLDKGKGVYPALESLAGQADGAFRELESRTDAALRGKVNQGAYDDQIRDLGSADKDLSAETAALRDVAYRQDELLRLIAASLKDPKITRAVTNLGRYTRERLGDKQPEKQA